MQPSFRERASQKSFELSYAIFRVSSVMRSRTFAEKLEHQSLNLLEASTRGDHESMKQTLQTIEYFLRLAADTNLIHGPHAEQIFHELVQLYRALESHEEKEPAPPVSLEGIFSSVPLSEEKSGNPAEAEPHMERILDSGDAAKNFNRNHSLSAETRQSKILELIRQSGNCRFKDLLEALPDSSERTLRYDLQDLIERRLIERLGAGGPATYYQALPETAPAGPTV